MVGMTGMPEAALARELNIDYASFALSVNWGAGLSDELITLDEIHVVLQSSIGFVMDVLKEIIGPTSSR
jgi:purine nucleoside phosphorylase